MPSRSVTSTMKSLFGFGRAISMRLSRKERFRHHVGGGDRGRRHDVEIAGVVRQIMRGTLDLEEHRSLESGAGADFGDADRIVVADHLELYVLLEPIARRVAAHLLDHR